MHQRHIAPLVAAHGIGGGSPSTPGPCVSDGLSHPKVPGRYQPGSRGRSRPRGTAANRCPAAARSFFVITRQNRVQPTGHGGTLAADHRTPSEIHKDNRSAMKAFKSADVLVFSGHHYGDYITAAETLKNKRAMIRRQTRSPRAGHARSGGADASAERRAARGAGHGIGGGSPSTPGPCVSSRDTAGLSRSSRCATLIRSRAIENTQSSMNTERLTVDEACVHQL